MRTSKAGASASVFTALAVVGPFLSSVAGCMTHATQSAGNGSNSGEVKLVARHGKRLDLASGNYGDRNLCDVEFVDYSRTKSAIAFVDNTVGHSDARFEISPVRVSAN